MNSTARTALKRFAPDMTDAQILDRWNASKAVWQFERGQIDRAQFAAAFVREWSLAMTESAFLSAFAAWVNGCFAGTMPLVRALRTDFRVGCLSSTNEVHWERLAELREQFDFSFASHLTGFMRPDQSAYELAVSTLGAQASEVFFFDDLSRIVAAARRLGINGFLVTSPQDIETVPIAHDLLPSERN